MTNKMCACNVSIHIPHYTGALIHQYKAYPVTEQGTAVCKTKQHNQLFKCQLGFM